MSAFEMTLLYDYYGKMLTGKQQEYIDMRYNQDLSLGEIAEIQNENDYVKNIVQAYVNECKHIKLISHWEIFK